MELVVVIAIIAILAVLAIPVISAVRSRAERVQCTSNLRTLAVGANLFVQQNGSWPQIPPPPPDEAAEDHAKAWIAALQPFGVPAKSWICPTIQHLLEDPDYTAAGNERVDYIATQFDDKPTSPHEWPRQPWFIEAGDVHGNGNLIIFTDGSVGDLATEVKNIAAAP